MTSNPLLDVRDLRLEYAGTTGAVTILKGVSLQVHAGETIGLVGESGSGKSSTARCALQLLDDTASTSGSVRLGDTEMLGASPKALREVRARRVAFIQQDPKAALNPVRRIGDSVTERLVRVHGMDKRDAYERALALIEAVGISHPERRMRQYPHELSGGMLQRVVIAAALTTQPQLLLADEMTSALDVTTQAEVLAILRQRQREHGLGVLFITHDLHLAAAYCDRVYVMYQGVIVEELRGENLFKGATQEYTQQLLNDVPTLERNGNR